MDLSASTSYETVHVFQDTEKTDFKERELTTKLCSVMSTSNDHLDLQHRLRDILCCTACSRLPKCAMFQCKSGHLICSGCLSQIQLDSHIRNETATCVKCRAVISKELCSRNVAVEKAISELPVKCSYCSSEVAQRLLENHETVSCDHRPTHCSYKSIGCLWTGPFCEHLNHEKVCHLPSTTGAEIMQMLTVTDQKYKEQKQLYTTLFEVLSYEKVLFNDLQFRSCDNASDVEVIYETSRFTALGYQWTVQACINTSLIHAPEKAMHYKVFLKSKPSSPFTVHYILLKGPYSELKIAPKLYQFRFSEKETETHSQPFILSETVEFNKLLSSKYVDLRLVMFSRNK